VINIRESGVGTEETRTLATHTHGFLSLLELSNAHVVNCVKTDL
jgi:hypothetical protein